jgi:hypothetical protein
LFAEIRASFYRKLFLFFVVAAIGPVVLFAIAFGTYMTERLRADVESEASSVVLMARRVLDQLGAALTPIGQTRPAPDDNVMVWIRQVVDQDVNSVRRARPFSPPANATCSTRASCRRARRPRFIARSRSPGGRSLSPAIRSAPSATTWPPHPSQPSAATH